MNQYSIPRNSPLRFLPLVYFLPAELLAGSPTLRTLPRCFSEVAKSETHIATIESDQFLNEIMMATARLVFPHFGLRGWVEHYTGYCPAWALAYVTPAWAKALEDEIGWGVQALFDLRKDEYILFFEPEYAKEVMGRAVQRGIAEQGWQGILDTVREIPCHEDFEPYGSRVYRDFCRKWYHTRSKKVKMVSLDQCLADEAHSIHDLAADSVDIAGAVEAEDFAERFKERLSEKDLQILELRAEGHTFERIAAKMGYKTHSGVMKRIWAIRDEFIKYENEQP